MLVSKASDTIYYLLEICYCEAVCTLFKLENVHKWYTGKLRGKFLSKYKPLTFAASPSGRG